MYSMLFLYFRKNRHFYMYFCKYIVLNMSKPFYSHWRLVLTHFVMVIRASLRMDLFSIFIPFFSSKTTFFLGHFNHTFIPWKHSYFLQTRCFHCFCCICFRIFWNHKKCGVWINKSKVVPMKSTLYMIDQKIEMA